jgi:hypothetical protein
MRRYIFLVAKSFYQRGSSSAYHFVTIFSERKGARLIKGIRPKLGKARLSYVNLGS